MLLITHTANKFRAGEFDNNNNFFVGTAYDTFNCQIQLNVIDGRHQWHLIEFDNSMYYKQCQQKTCCWQIVKFN